MNESSISLFLLEKKNKFPQYVVNDIRQKMSEMSNHELTIVQSLDYKDPIMIFVVSFMFGSLGIDRFLMGDTILGVLKLITLGGCGIWTIIDWFLVIDRTRYINYETFDRFARSFKQIQKNI